MSILDQLGVDEADFVWQDLALCQNFPTVLFYDEYESSKVVAKQVDAMCAACPVRKDCLLAGMDGEYGVWGGIFWNGYGKPDLNRNSHKPEGWKEEMIKVIASDD